nr:hypothetical protein [Tanacetum cinerariifolium]
MPTTQAGMTPEAIEELIAQRVAEVLVAHEANRNIKNIVEGGDENDNGNGGRNGNENGNGGGDRNLNGNNNNGSGNHGENVGTTMQATHEEEKIKRYIWGLPNNIQGNVTSAGTTRLLRYNSND